MSKKVKWSWTSALVGAASATAVAAIIMCKPRDPTFHLISITPKPKAKASFVNLNLPPLLDGNLILSVHFTNPNIVPVRYSATEMSIFYGDCPLGSARIDAGSQPPRSCQILQLPTRLNGLQLAHHAARFISDVGRRKMVLDAAVDMEGTAKVMWWERKFKIHLDSHVVVDPVFLDVIDQENKSEMKVFSLIK